jgi:hypothetical protein
MAHYGLGRSDRLCRRQSARQTGWGTFHCSRKADHSVPCHRVSQLPNFARCRAKGLQGKNQGKRREILPIFQRDYFNRECASSIPPWSATQSLDLRLRSILARNACNLRVNRAFAISLQALKTGNFRENLPKVSSPNRKNSRFGETFLGDNFDLH